MPCSSDCATCVDSNDKCLSCTDPLKVWKQYQCLPGCTTGYIRIVDLCCSQYCTGCDQTEACSGCIPSYFLDTLKRCLPCDASCQTCITSASNCVTCPPGKVFQTGKCQDTCNDKFYNDAGICKACHSSCLHCSGPADTQCIACDNLHFFWKNLCYSCRNDQPNFDQSRFEEKGGRCWEKCGISGKLSVIDIPEGLGGYKACDDGNLINGDGCSSSCTVEKNFNCIGGAENAKDTCYTLVKPVAEIIPIDNSSNFQISFSKMLNFKNITVPSASVKFPITLEIANVDKSMYEVVWKKPTTPEFDYVNFTIKPKESILKGRGTVYFERNLISDKFNNTLTNIKLAFNFTIYVDKRFLFEPVFDVLQVANQISTFMVPVSSLGITNYILQNFIRYMTTFQIIGAGIYYNVQQTSTVRTFLTSANNVSSRTLPGPIALMKSKITVQPTTSSLNKKIKTYTRVLLTPNVSGTTSAATATGSSTASKVTNISSYSDLYDTSSAAEPFRRNGYVNSMLPNLGFSIVIILITGIWYFLASAFLFGKVTVKSGCVKRFFAFNAERSFYTCMMFGSLELSVFSMNNLLNPKFDHVGHILSFACSILTVLVLITLPIILYNIANHYTITLWNPEYYQRYGFIYCEFKLNSKPRKAFMSILMTRIILFGFVMAGLARNPVPQTISAFMIHLIYYCIMVKIKPFVSLILFITAIIAGSPVSPRILRHGIVGVLHHQCDRQRAEDDRQREGQRKARPAELHLHHDRHPRHDHRHHDHDHPQARAVHQKDQVREAVQEARPQPAWRKEIADERKRQAAAQPGGPQVTDSADGRQRRLPAERCGLKAEGREERVRG